MAFRLDSLTEDARHGEDDQGLINQTVLKVKR